MDGRFSPPRKKQTERLIRRLKGRRKALGRCAILFSALPASQQGSSIKAANRWPAAGAAGAAPTEAPTAYKNSIIHRESRCQTGWRAASARAANPDPALRPAPAAGQGDKGSPTRRAKSEKPPSRCRRRAVLSKDKSPDKKRGAFFSCAASHCRLVSIFFPSPCSPPFSFNTNKTAAT